MNIKSLAKQTLLLIEPFNVEPIEGYIRLSLNENPSLPPPIIRSAYLRSWEYVNRYTPLEILEEFRDEVSLYNNVSPLSIFVGPGADTILTYIADAFLWEGKVAAMLKYTYPVYMEESIKRGAKVKLIPMDESFNTKFEDIVDAASYADVLFLCNPNNPTGNLVIFTLEEMKEILDAAKGIVVVDEAYYEFSGFSVVPLLDQYDNLIVVRTFSKGFALAGLRIGYAITSPEIVNILSRVSQPYVVSTTSMVVATEALRYSRYAYENARRLKESLYRIKQTLIGMGLKVYPSVTNFLVVEAPRGTWLKLRKNRVLTRLIYSSKDSDKDVIRISAGDRVAVTRFLKVFSNIVLGEK